MPAITPDLNNRLRDTLAHCGCFAGDRELIALFTDARIHPWHDRVPNNAPDIAARVDALIEALYDQANDAGENALFLFLRVLADRTLPADALHKTLTDLAADLETLWNDPGPQLPPQIPHLPLHALIGRQAEKRALLDLAADIRRTGKGHTVFVTGEPGMGRHALAEWLRQELSAQKWTVAAARFWADPRISAAESRRLYWDTPAMAQHGAQLKAASAHLQAQFALDPWLNLLAQLAGAAFDPQNAPWPDQPDALARCVRDVARRSPLLLCVEYLDAAPPIWLDHLRRLAGEIALDAPVLLLVTLAAPFSLDRLAEKHHIPATRLALHLQRETNARWYHLAAISAESLVSELTPTAPELGERLHALTAGDPRLIALFWETWLQEEAIMLGADGHWRVVPGRMGQWWVFGDVWSHGRRLLQQALNAGPQPPPFTLEQAETILNCAACEATTDPYAAFTAEAVAYALGEAFGDKLDPDDLIDFFDDYLRAPLDVFPIPDSALLLDCGPVELYGGGSLCTYRFARPYLLHIWAKYPHLEQQRRTWAGDLAEALESYYGPNAGLVARKLADLFNDAGLPQRAASYRHTLTPQPDIEQQLAHVQFLIANTPDDDAFGTYRLFDLGFALCGALLPHGQLWQPALALAQELYRRASLPAYSDRLRQADALYYQSSYFGAGGDFSAASNTIRQAVAIHETAPPPKTALARSLTVFGWVQERLGQYGEARALLERALALTETAYGPAHTEVASILHDLGGVQVRLGQYGEARALLERALALKEAAFGPDHPEVASTLHNLGWVLYSLGQYGEAQALLERALAIDEAAYGPAHPIVASILHALGGVQARSGQYGEARALLERALGIDEAAYGPAHPEVASILHDLGWVLYSLGQYGEAQALMERALALKEAAYGPDHPSVASTLNFLGRVLDHLGQSGEARAAFERALAIGEAALGPDHPNTQTIRQNLAIIEEELHQS